MSTNTISAVDQLQERVQITAVSKGWVALERSVCEDWILIHDEITEVYEEVLAGHPLNEIYYRGGKPEGVPIEIADIGIRILSHVYSANKQSMQELLDLLPAVETQVDTDIWKTLLRWHTYVSKTLEYWRDGNEYDQIRLVDGKAEGCLIYLAMLWVDIAQWCESVGIDMMGALHQKADYNDTRPYRHGGKRV